MATKSKPTEKTTIPAGLTPAEAFFYEWGSHSYTPGKETPEEGRIRSARESAAAEAWLMSRPHTLQWVNDTDADRSWLKKGDKRPLYGCVVAVSDGDADPEEWKSESLWGIDFGPKGMGDSETYTRVVVAQLAEQLMEE